MAARSSGRRRWGWVALVGLAVAVALGAVLVLNRPAPTRYTTAVVTTGTVTERWIATGTVARVEQSAAAFATTGEVTAIRVKVGDVVAAGQELATLDPLQLQLAVVQARATVAQAQAQLDADKTAGSNTSAATQAAAAAQDQAKAFAQLQAQVQQLSAQVQQLSAQAATAKAEAALSKAQLQAEVAWREKVTSGLLAAARSPECQAILQAVPTPSSPGPTPAPTPDPTATPTLTPPDPDQVSACVTAFRDLVTLASRPPSSPPTPQAPQVPQVPQAPKAPVMPTPAAAPAPAAAAPAASGTLSAEARDARVAASRASLLQAQQNLATAERALANATLTAPIAGRVGAMTLAEGLSSAGKSITLVGGGAAEVTVQVPLSVRPLLSDGQPATVSPPGSPLTFAGTVGRINLLPTASSGTPTYSAVVTVGDPDGQLYAGSLATVTVAVGEVKDVTVVPASAVTPTGDTTGTVQLVESGVARTVNVHLGARGNGRVQVTDGVQPGQVVVLADRSQAVPANSFQQQQRRPSASPSAVSSTGATAVPSATPAR